jgi:hypothetical protein
MVALAAPPAAGAATRRATDREARVRFTLEGRVLTARLLHGAPARVRRQLYGRTVKAVCGTDFNFDRARKVRDWRRWPRGRRTVRFRFRRDISRRAKWCLLEHPRGGDVAYVNFAP